MTTAKHIRELAEKASQPIDDGILVVRPEGVCISVEEAKAIADLIEACQLTLDISGSIEKRIYEVLRRLEETNDR